ncbi:hypothetical protein H181DRAFT_02032 [Streptomyces sp. WMMB 714]|uniref:hypothetical protein n=1 Tax=Streptomyces sp. WMMB 714 TaxID=1286822 RepID=UPI000823C8CC|nr:hypothetical protein [Streptomyces sp. WMMB 714]SCK25976.1 hypothetical protein H181DRAFT_02032 [Streptomyces sp. WMMB 714]
MTSVSTLQPGSVHTRAEICAVFGGSSQGGICPSVETKRVMLFSDPKVAKKNGYHHDGWLAEEDALGPIFEYTGAGRSGDQGFVGQGGPTGNKAVLIHAQQGRTLEVFVREGTAPNSEAATHRYLGTFAVDEDQPYVPRQGAGADGKMRTAIVFRLRPIDAVEKTARDAIVPASDTFATEVPRAVTSDMLQTAVNSGEFFAAPDIRRQHNSEALRAAAQGKLVPMRASNVTEFKRAAAVATTVRREKAILIEEYVNHLESNGHIVNCLQITIKGKTSILRTDFFDSTENVLYEAQGASDRDSIRLALARLLDYRRYSADIANQDGLPESTILLPSHPEDTDLLKLLEHHEVSLIYRSHEGFIKAV